MNDRTDEAIRSMLDYMTSTGCYAPSTIQTYSDGTRMVMNIMHAHVDAEVTPDRVTAQNVIDLDAYLKASGYAPSTIRTYLSHLKILCEYSDNNVFRRVKLTHQADTRPTVDWLTLMDAERILGADLNPVEEVVVWLGLCHGLRCVEVTRLTVDDVDVRHGIITVTGKGRGGGKLRTVPMHPDFGTVFDRWMECRAQLTADAADVSDAFVVYRRGSDVRSYAVHGIQWLMWKMSHRIDVEFSMHTLRRTFGRELWHCGVSVATIAAMMGHSSTDTTLRYLGVNLDDMTDAMNLLNLGKK